MVEFITRRDCHLCEAARKVIAELLPPQVDLVDVDVDSDELLRGRFGLRVPVLRGPGGVILAEGAIDDGRSLQRRLEELAG